MAILVFIMALKRILCFNINCSIYYVYDTSFNDTNKSIKLSQKTYPTKFHSTIDGYIDIISIVETIAHVDQFN